MKLITLFLSRPVVLINIPVSHFNRLAYYNMHTVRSVSALNNQLRSKCYCFLFPPQNLVAFTSNYNFIKVCIYYVDCLTPTCAVFHQRMPELRAQRPPRSRAGPPA